MHLNSQWCVNDSLLNEYLEEFEMKCLIFIRHKLKDNYNTLCFAAIIIDLSKPRCLWKPFPVWRKGVLISSTKEKYLHSLVMHHIYGTIKKKNHSSKCLCLEVIFNYSALLTHVKSLIALCRHEQWHLLCQTLSWTGLCFWQNVNSSVLWCWFVY